VEKELSDICQSILQLLDDHLIPTASTGESKEFYLKMKGDYHRYLAEFKTGSDRKEAAEHTLLAYKAAQARGQGGGLGRTPGLHSACAHYLCTFVTHRISPWWTSPPHTPSAWA
jgi:hypothetical protein